MKEVVYIAESLKRYPLVYYPLITNLKANIPHSGMYISHRILQLWYDINILSSKEYLWQDTAKK